MDQASSLENGILLGYYRTRIDAFETERDDLLSRLDACTVDKSELYRLTEENRKRAEEVRELQTALSDAHTYLYDERERILQLQAENDRLKLQETEDRARIKQLLAITRASDKQSAGRQEKCIVSAVQYSVDREKGSGLKLQAGRVPAALTESQALKCNLLQAQLQEQTQFAAEKLAALTEDRQLRENDMEAQMQAASQAIISLEQRVKGAEEALRRTTKDFIVARQAKDSAEAEAAVLKTSLEIERRQAEMQLVQEQQKATVELEHMKQTWGSETDELLRGLEQQLRQREDEMTKLETVHKLIKSQLESRLVSAEDKASRLAQQHAQLSQRRAMDMEGWVNDVSMLRKQISATDRRVRQMRVFLRLPNDERRDQILDRHYRMAPSIADGDDNNYDRSIDELVNQMTAIKYSLLEMGQRVRNYAELPDGVGA